MLIANLINPASTSPTAVDDLMIYAWAQEHKDRVGAYPHLGSGPIVSNETPAAGVTWSNIGVSLKNQIDGLPPGLTLRAFIESHHRVFVPLNEKQILNWARAHKQKHGEYPAWHFGAIEHREADGDSWANINSALFFGLRGLEGGRTLAELLEQQDQSKNILSPELVLQWADAYRDANGAYPKEATPGTIPGTGFTWRDIDKALINGLHGLPKRKPRDDLWSFLERNRKAGQLVPAKSQLSIKKIIDFAIAHVRAVGEMPHALSGHVAGTHSETWMEIDSALRNGGRGFAGGEDLKSLLDEFFPHDQIDEVDAVATDSAENVLLLAPRRRGRPRKEVSAPVLAEVIAIGDAPRKRGRPRKEIPLESDSIVSASALQPLAEPKRRGRPRKIEQAPVAAVKVATTSPAAGRYGDLTLEQILNWIDAHKQSEGYYPLATSGKIPGADGKNWFGVQNALKDGVPGVEAGISLAKLIKKYRARKISDVAVAGTADLFDSPNDQSKQREDKLVSAALFEKGAGNFGEEFASSAMETHRARVSKGRMVEISEDNVLKWIDNYVAKNRVYPTVTSGDIDEAPGITWAIVAAALEGGNRHLPTGGSLNKFLFEQYGVIGSKIVGAPKHKVFEHHA